MFVFTAAAVLLRNMHTRLLPSLYSTGVYVWFDTKGTCAGNFNNFLFQLSPQIAVFGPSGANQNFQYCGHNFASLPNGLGFGGQVNYWSLFIDGLFESGMSHKGATYTNPSSLSAETNFQVCSH